MALIKVLEWVFTDSAISGVPRWSDDTKTPGEGLANCATCPTPALSHVSRPVSLSLSRLSWEDAGVAHGAPDGCEERWVWCVVEEAGVHGSELGPRTDQPRRQRRRTQTTRRLRHRPARGDGTPKQWKDGLFSSRRNPNLLYIETMKVCKKWLLYSNGEHSDSLGKTVVKWIML